MNLSEQKNKRNKALCCIILIGVMVMFNLVLASAWTSDRFIEDTEKQQEKDSLTKYGTYEIIEHKWWDILKIWTEEKIKEIILEDNTDECSDNCFAIKEVTNLKPMPLIEDVRFFREIDGKWVSWNSFTNWRIEVEEDVDIFETQCIQGKEIIDEKNGTSYFEQDCSQVLIGTEKQWKPLDYKKDYEGTYRVKLSGGKKPDVKYDWQVKMNGVWSEEWAVWGNMDEIVQDYHNDNPNKYGDDSGYGFNSFNNADTYLYYYNERNFTDKRRIEEIGFILMKVGNPTGSANISIFNGSERVQTKEINIITLPTSSLTKEITGVTFELNEQVYLLGNITYGVEYFGNSDSSNHIRIAITNTNPPYNPFNEVFYRTNSSGIISQESSAVILVNMTLFSGDAEVILNSPDDEELLFTNLVTLNATGNVTGGAYLVNASLWDDKGGWSLKETRDISSVRGNITTEEEVPSLTLSKTDSQSLLELATRINVTEDLTLINVTRYHGVTATRCLLLNDSRTLLANGTFVGENCELNYDLEVGVIYRIGIDSGGASYTRRYLDGSPGYPFTSTNGLVNYISGTDSVHNPQTTTWQNLGNLTVSRNQSISEIEQTFTQTYNAGDNIIWNMQFCDTDGDCGFATQNRTFSIPFYEVAREFNPTSTITTNEQFNLTIQTDGTQTPIVYLVYDGNSTLSTLSGGKYITTIGITEAGEKEFYWSINYGGIIINTTSSTQNVSSLTAMEIKEGACSAGLTQVANFTFANAQNLTALSEVNIKYNFKYGITDAEGASSFGSLNNISQFSVCLNVSQSESYLIGYGEIEYEKTDYSSRRYYFFENTRLSNVTINRTLYSLLNSDSTSFLVEIRKPTLEPYDGKYTTLLRWYPNLNEYRVVEMGQTDDKGQTVKKVKIEDVDYRIGVYDRDGTLIHLANPIRMVCLASPCSYTLTVRDVSDTTFDELKDIETSLTYSNGTFRLVYNDPSQNTEMIELVVYKITGSAETVICRTNSTEFTGILTCNIGEETGLVKATVFRTASPTRIIAQLIKDLSKTIFQGTFGLFLQFLITATVAFLGIISPVVAIIMGLFSMILGIILFKTITYPVLIAFGIIGGIVIHFMMREGGR